MQLSRMSFETLVRINPLTGVRCNLDKISEFYELDAYQSPYGCEVQQIITATRTTTNSINPLTGVRCNPRNCAEKIRRHNIL